MLDVAPGVLPSREDRARRLREHPSRGRHRENLLWLDDAIGALLGKLQAAGELDRTVVFFELGFTRGVRKGDWRFIALRYPSQPERFALVNNPPHLKNFPRPPGQPAFGHIGGNNNEASALRTHPAYFDRDQLYRLEDDPREQRNLAGDHRYAAKLAEMKRELQRQRARQRAA